MDDVVFYDIPYNYQGIVRNMRVKRVGLGASSAVFYEIKSKDGIRNIRKSNGKWIVSSPRPMRDELLQVVGNAIEGYIQV